MKRTFFAIALGLAAASSFATDVGVSVSVNQPGLYGRIDIGHVPQPPVLVYPQPIIVQQPAVVVQRQPIYLHVPPGHAKNWSKHCGKYNACAQPVYFVQEGWYQQQYVPVMQAREQEKHKHKHKHKDKGHGHGHGKGKGKDD